MPLSVAAVLVLAARCAPSVAPETLAAIIRVESGFDPLAIGVNAKPGSHMSPATTDAAVATATGLIAAGRNIDLGLGQINSRNLGLLGLTVRDAFDPCRNLAAAAKVLQQGYVRASASGGGPQAALRTALSYYNTGQAELGFRNGYVAKVTVAAGIPIPKSEPAAPGATDTAAAPAWDVFARRAVSKASFVFNSNAEGGAP